MFGPSFICTRVPWMSVTESDCESEASTWARTNPTALATASLYRPSRGVLPDRMSASAAMQVSATSAVSRNPSPPLMFDDSSP